MAAALDRTLPSFDRKPLIYFAAVVSVCLCSGRNAEQIEGAVLCGGGGGEDGGEAIAPEADDIAGERGEIEGPARALRPRQAAAFGFASEPGKREHFGSSYG